MGRYPLTAAAALARLEVAGVKLALRVDGTVAMQAAVPPAPDLLAEARQHREGIAAALRQREAGNGAAGACGAPSPACRPDPARAGFVGTEAGAFVHWCAVCGAWGCFGYGVDLRAGKPGRWFCLAHRPQLRAGQLPSAREPC